MGMYGGSSDAGSSLQAQQAAQQAQVAQGVADINAVFSGTSGAGAPTGPWSATTQYYDQYGQPLPIGQQPTGSYFTETQSTGGFNQDFYNQRAQAFENFAEPQLAQQYQKEQANTNYGLARVGLTNSSAANYLGKSLANEMTTNQQGIANQGLSQAQALQSQISQEQNTLIGQAEAGASPSTSAQQATEAASQFQAPSAFAPIGPLFANWQNSYLTNQLANAYQPVLSTAAATTAGSAGGSIAAPTSYSTPSFGAPLGGSSYQGH